MCNDSYDLEKYNYDNNLDPCHPTCRACFLLLPHTDCIEPSPAACEIFLHFFIEKVSSTSAQISPFAHDPSVSASSAAVFDRFEPMTLSSLKETFGHFNPAGSPNDAVPPRLLKECYQQLDLWFLSWQTTVGCQV